jgi:hypothetical protein
MKNTVALVCYILFLIGCKQTVNNDSFNFENGLLGEIKLDDETTKFILDFIQSRNNANCIYELYIDKKTEDEYFVTLFNVPNDSNYFTSHFPVNYTIVNSKIIFIYSGIEDFINRKDYSTKLEIKNTKLEKNISYETISKVIERDTSYIVGDIGLPFTNIKFSPPVYFNPIEE